MKKSQMIEPEGLAGIGMSSEYGKPLPGPQPVSRKPLHADLGRAAVIFYCVLVCRSKGRLPGESHAIAKMTHPHPPPLFEPLFRLLANSARYFTDVHERCLTSGLRRFDTTEEEMHWIGD